MMNRKYLYAPVILGVIPIAIFWFFLFLIWLIPIQILAIPAGLALWFLLVYEMPAVYLGEQMGMKFPGLMDIPADFNSLIFIAAVYVLVGLLINLILGIRLMKSEGKSPIGA